MSEIEFDDDIRQQQQQQPQNIAYTQEYLKKQIGKRVLMDFLIGTNTYQDREGILETVGIDYVILREQGGTRLLCDLYSMKFVTIFEQ